MSLVALMGQEVKELDSVRPDLDFRAVRVILAIRLDQGLLVGQENLNHHRFPVAHEILVLLAGQEVLGFLADQEFLEFPEGT